MRRLEVEYNRFYPLIYKLILNCWKIPSGLMFIPVPLWCDCRCPHIVVLPLCPTLRVPQDVTRVPEELKDLQLLLSDQYWITHQWIGNQGKSINTGLGLIAPDSLSLSKGCSP